MIETKTAYLTQYSAFTIQIQDIYEVSLSANNFPCEYTHTHKHVFLDCNVNSGLLRCKNQDKSRSEREY